MPKTGKDQGKLGSGMKDFGGWGAVKEQRRDGLDVLQADSHPRML